MGKTSPKSKEGRGLAANITKFGSSRDVDGSGSGESFIQSGTGGEHRGVTIVEDQEKNLSRSLSQRHIQVSIFNCFFHLKSMLGGELLCQSLPLFHPFDRGERTLWL